MLKNKKQKSLSLVTSSSLDVISSCSLQVCGENRHKRMSMKSQKKSNKKDLIIFLFKMRPGTAASSFCVCVCFFTLILSRDWSSQILSGHAVLVLIQGTKSVIINCNSSAIKYGSMFILLIFCLSMGCVCQCVWGGRRRSAYPVIIFCLCSKVFWENINYMFNKGQRLNRPRWPQPHLPWHIHTHTHDQ